MDACAHLLFSPPIFQTIALLEIHLEALSWRGMILSSVKEDVAELLTSPLSPLIVLAVSPRNRKQPSPDWQIPIVSELEVTMKARIVFIYLVGST